MKESPKTEDHPINRVLELLGVEWTGQQINHLSVDIDVAGVVRLGINGFVYRPANDGERDFYGLPKRKP